jgi:hypothetical protein
MSIRIATNISGYYNIGYDTFSPCSAGMNLNGPTAASIIQQHLVVGSTAGPRTLDREHMECSECSHDYDELEVTVAPRPSSSARRPLTELIPDTSCASGDA